MMKMPILDKHDTWEDMRDKLQEEAAETLEAINEIKNKDPEDLKEEDLYNIAGETLDTIQVCIGILDYIARKRYSVFKNCFDIHVKKLLSRKWIFKYMLYIMPCSPNMVFDTLEKDLRRDKNANDKSVL